MLGDESLDAHRCLAANLLDQIVRPREDPVGMVDCDLPEVLGMSDRALVMHEGRINGQLQRHELSEEAIMHLATGRPSVAAVA